MSTVGRATTYAVFSALHTLTGREHQHYPYPSPASALSSALAGALPFPIDEHSNDGIVPTLSQLYGEFLMATVADHLDVVGQFHGAGGHPYADWLSSGSRFGEQAFGVLWERIAATIAANHGDGWAQVSHA